MCPGRPLSDAFSFPTKIGVRRASTQDAVFDLAAPLYFSFTKSKTEIAQTPTVTGNCAACASRRNEPPLGIAKAIPIHRVSLRAISSISRWATTTFSTENATSGVLPSLPSMRPTNGRYIIFGRPSAALITSRRGLLPRSWGSISKCLVCRVPMSNYSPARGRRKVVEEFTSREGLWILGILAVILLGILLLLLSGYLDADMH